MPASISYKSTPNDHQSTVLLYGRYRTICSITAHRQSSQFKYGISRHRHLSINFRKHSYILHAKPVTAVIHYLGGLVV